MRAAMRQLGFNDCYHMHNVIADNAGQGAQWIKALEAKYEGKGTFTRADWDKLLGNSQACVDLPAALFGVEIAETYPEAKVIILNRDPEKWYDSVLNSIYKLMSANKRISNLPKTLLFYAFDPEFRAMLKFHGAMQRCALRYDHGKEKDKALAWYKNQYDEFREHIPAERRIEYKVQDGWGPLCEYLEVPIPMVKDEVTGKEVEAPFPRVNDRDMFADAAKEMQAGTHAQVVTNMFSFIGKAALTGLVGYGGYLFWKERLGGRF